MNEFESIEQLDHVFKTGRFDLPDNISMHGLKYHRSQATAHSIPELKAGKKEFVVYALYPSARNSEQWKAIANLPVEERPIQEWIVLIWALDGTLSVRPARAVTNSAARAKVAFETTKDTIGEGQNNIIADSVQIKFVQFNKQVVGKVDTGANLSSLHCENWKVDAGKNVVEFSCSLLSDNVIRTELLDNVAIKTSEGSEYRPVIALDVSINDKMMQNSRFNLNDRSHMQDKILVGQNILEKGRFLVDPNLQQDQFEDIDWDALQELYGDVGIIEESVEENNKQIDDLYQAMLDSDVTMSDLAHHILVNQEN